MVNGGCGDLVFIARTFSMENTFRSMNQKQFVCFYLFLLNVYKTAVSISVHFVHQPLTSIKQCFTSDRPPQLELEAALAARELYVRLVVFSQRNK